MTETYKKSTNQIKKVDDILVCPGLLSRQVCFNNGPQWTKMLPTFISNCRHLRSKDKHLCYKNYDSNIKQESR